jgi:hypothetical protein
MGPDDAFEVHIPALGVPSGFVVTVAARGAVVLEARAEDGAVVVTAARVVLVAPAPPESTAWAAFPCAHPAKLTTAIPADASAKSSRLIVPSRRAAAKQRPTKAAEGIGLPVMPAAACRSCRLPSTAGPSGFRSWASFGTVF